MRWPLPGCAVILQLFGSRLLPQMIFELKPAAGGARRAGRCLGAQLFSVARQSFAFSRAVWIEAGRGAQCAGRCPGADWLPGCTRSFVVEVRLGFRPAAGRACDALAAGMVPPQLLACTAVPGVVCAGLSSCTLPASSLVVCTAVSRLHRTPIKCCSPDPLCRSWPIRRRRSGARWRLAIKTFLSCCRRRAAALPACRWALLGMAAGCWLCGVCCAVAQPVAEGGRVASLQVGPRCMAAGCRLCVAL